MRRVVALVMVCVLAGCCSSWRAGTPGLRGYRYKPSLEPWAGHDVRAERETHYCNYLIGAHTYRSYWKYEGSRTPLKDHPTKGERQLYDKGLSGHDFVSRTNRVVDNSLFGTGFRVGASEHAQRFMSAHDVAVVCVNPLVFVTYPSTSPSGWLRDHHHYSHSDIRGATEFVTSNPVTVWVPQPDDASDANRGIELPPSGHFRYGTEWGALVFSRGGDRYLVTTEGHE